MLIEQGRISSLSTKPWAAVRLKSDIRLEEVALHISRWAKSALHGLAFQMLFPIQSRDLNGIKMLTPYLMARTVELKQLRGLRSLYGVEGLETDLYGKIMEIEDSFVQEVRAKAEEIYNSWSSGIEPGSFVRILLGRERMLCGTVERIDLPNATVKVSMFSRDLIVETPIHSLLHIRNIPSNERHYCYVPGLLGC